MLYMKTALVSDFHCLQNETEEGEEKRTWPFGHMERRKNQLQMNIEMKTLIRNKC